MGITKQYLKYVSGGNLNLIASSNCNIKFITLENQEGRFVAVGACEHVYIWDLRLSEKVQVISGDNVNVSCLESSSNKQQIAVGYLNGVIKTFNLRTAENISEFIGHNSEITCLAYDYLGHRLVSGSKDTNIIIWDIIAEIGICKLVGHKGIITKVAFMKNYNIVISSSKDTFVKFWDVNTAHNFKTLIDHRSEVWDFILIKNDNYLVTGCNDCELYIWKIYFNNNSNSDFNAIDLTVEDNGDDNYMKYPLRCIKVDKIIRVSKGRLHGLTIDYTEQVIGCYGNDNMIELFHFLSENQLKNKRSKHVKLKRKELDNENVVECEKRNESELDTIIWGKINRLPVIKVSSKVKAIDIIIGQGKELRVCTIVSNNTIELHSVLITENTTESQCLRIISSHGHRTDVRAIYFSSDSLAFVTISGDSVKLWNRPTLRCLRTIESRYALSVIFVPGDRHLIVGLRSGKMLIIDIASGDILEEIPAHQKELWSIALLPTFKGFVTGSEDKTVKFWQFELIDSEDSSIAKVLSVIHYRTLKLEESVLCVKISPNNRFLAISLLDSTVKIFFLDTFKFFISLYGHKLPVLCMDISSDSTLIATGSADRNIKIWGLDFGDCHKSLFAHDDSVTGIAFVPKTHYLFTCGKDGKVKEWDADSFQKIITLPGHTNQAFNCAVSPNGFYIASCGSDKLVRLHERSSEILVLEDESEKEREAQINNLSSEITSMSAKKNQILPTCKTINSEQGAELILECLEICKIYKKECSTVIPPNSLPPLPLVMQLYKCNSIEEFLLETVKRIRVSDLEESLMLIPYYAAYEILKMIPNLMKSYQAELVAKLTLSLIQAHYGPFIRSEELLPQIKKIESLVLTQVCTLRNTLGFNLYALAYIQRGMEEKDDIHLFKEHAKKKKKVVKGKKKKILKE